jgi:hypothetical protein
MTLAASSVTALAPIGCVAAASDGSNCLATLVRRDGESLSQLIERLDKAIGLAWSQGLFTDEVKQPRLLIGLNRVINTGSPDAYRSRSSS